MFSAMCSAMAHRRSMVLCLHLIKMFSEELNQARSLIIRGSWCVFKCCEKTQIEVYNYTVDKFKTDKHLLFAGKMYENIENLYRD